MPDDKMVFYHSGASRPVLRKIRDVCPSLRHGNGWTPRYFFDRKHCYFLDNGAFTSSFNPEEWVRMLEKVREFESSPDFVVLPDKFNNPEKTFERSKKYVGEARDRGYSYYYAAQKPESPESAVRKAQRLDADGVFIGGDFDWKIRETSNIVDIAHERGFKAHIGMPGDYFWAYRTGADSMDSSTVGRNKQYRRMRSLERSINQQKSILGFF